MSSNPCDTGICNPEACLDKDCASGEIEEKLKPACYHMGFKFKYAEIYFANSAGKCCSVSKRTPDKGLTMAERKKILTAFLSENGFTV